MHHTIFYETALHCISCTIGVLQRFGVISHTVFHCNLYAAGPYHLYSIYIMVLTIVYYHIHIIFVTYWSDDIY